MCTGAADGFTRFSREVELEELCESPGPPNDRTESAGAQQIVADAVPFREPWLACEIGVRVEKVDRHRARRIINVKRPASQSFVQEPGAADGNPRGRGPDESLQLSFRNSLKGPLEDEQIDILVAKRKR
jgi:hypothetical protein